MILIHPSATIEAHTPDPERVIEAAGRTCYRSEGKATDDSAPAFLRRLIARGHESVLEHASVTVRFVVDRGVSHELVRHRLAAYSQESTRYCDYDKRGIAFVIPPWLSVPPGTWRPDGSPVRYANKRTGARFDVAEECGEAAAEWMLLLSYAEDAYANLRAEGWPPEQARGVLPNALATTLVMTANVREWRHVFALRCAPAAHPQMREVMVPLRAEMAARWPALFGGGEE